MKKRIFRDPVHSMIELDEDRPEEKLIVDLINTREVQRLRRLHQMGLGFLTFPGAEHSRFGHSLGSMCLVRRIFEQLKQDLERADIVDGQKLEELYPVAMSAGILHDLGHGPFSHVAERGGGKSHEDWTVAIITLKPPRATRCLAATIPSYHRS